MFIDDPVNNRQLGGTLNLRLGREGLGSSTYRGTSYGYQLIGVEEQRRYQVSLTGIRNAFGGVDAGVWYASAIVDGKQIGRTRDRNSDGWQTERDTFVTPAGSSELEFRFNSFLDFNSSSFSRWHEMRDARLELVINAPELGFSETDMWITVDDPHALSVDVSLTPLLINAFEDRPDTSSLNWGDGAVDSVMNFGSMLTHSYDIAGTGLYEFSAVFQGSNLAGPGSAVVNININVVPTPGGLGILMLGTLFAGHRPRRAGGMSKSVLC